MRERGTIAEWRDAKGFGFIAPEDSGRRIFVHISAFADKRRKPVTGDRIIYTPTRDADGRPRAENVGFAEARLSSVIGFFRKASALVIATGFLAFIALETHLGRFPLVLPGGYLALSAAAFILYALDKSAARNGRWRTREDTLHLVALLGGWPGALFAQTLLRHKSRKRSFQIVFRITVLLNCALLGWTLSPQGSHALRSITGALIHETGLIWP